MKNIIIREITVLRGPSRWNYQPALQAVVDIGELEDFPSNKIPGFPERLKAWLPGLVEHRCSYGERGGFLRRLDEGTWPVHIMEHVTLELQSLAGFPDGFGRARELDERGVYILVISMWEEPVTRAALELSRQLVMAAIEDRPFDIAAAVDTLKALVDDHCLGPSTNEIVSAADRRKIPFMRLNDGNLVQLGYGARQRRIWTAETDRTSAIAEGISRDKDLTKSLLRQCGVPVPEGREVASADDAWAAAEEIGVPVVVKPLDGNHGRGVFINLSQRDDIAAAYDVARHEGSGVIVERLVPGNEHRLLVVGGKLAAAARGDSASVVGDGRSTVQQLIDMQLNSDPLRGTHESSPLNLVRIDSSARLELKAQGLTADSVPAVGQSVLIQRNGNVAFDVTEQVHPDTARIVALAARIVGLDIAGIDLVAQDISRPLAEQGGAIVEVNAGPGLALHLTPAGGNRQPVGRAIVDHLFPDGQGGQAGDNGWIPVIGITGSGSNTAVAWLIAHLLDLKGLRVGLACRDGVYLHPRRLEHTDGANWASAHRMLVNRLVDAAVFENGEQAIATEGLAYDRCAIGVVTGFDPRMRIPEAHVITEDHLFNTVRTQVDLVLADGAAVLNADDPKVVEMAQYSDGEVILYAIREDNEALQAHRAKGGRVAFMRQGLLFTARGDAEEAAGRFDAMAAVRMDPARFTRSSVLAALASAMALGVPIALIRAGLAHFEPVLPAEVLAHA